MSIVVDIVLEPIKKIVEKLGYYLVDVEFKKIKTRDTLIVYIDQIEPNKYISIDDCEKVHYALDPILDQLNPTNDKPYDFNVSSPGLTRAFKTQRDFERNYNQMVDIKFYKHLEIDNKKQKQIKAKLINKKDNIIYIEFNNKILEIEFNSISRINKHLEF